jgi:hypothetical protein
MQELICPKCGPTTDYYTELKANNNVARCLKCDSFIKNLPQGNDPTFYFGKYKDKKVRDIEDMQYLKWVLGNLRVTSSMRLAIEKQISSFENLAR